MNALFVILAVASGTFTVSYITNVLWAGFFGYWTYLNVKTTNEIKAELAEKG